MARPRNFLLALLVAVCGVSLWWGWGRPLPHWPGETRAPAVAEEVGASFFQAEPVHLRVLNGTQEAGLAGDIALLVPRISCVVEGVGNAPEWPGSPSVLINRRLPADRAAALADLLGGIPVLKEWDGRVTEDAVLVLGEDYLVVREGLRTIQK